MARIKIEPITKPDYPRVVDVWEASVRATHDFLREDDIVRFRTLVPGLLGTVTLLGVRDDAGDIIAFLGVSGENVEMLFVHPSAIGKGVGRALLGHAVDELGATSVDVNEQNTQAVGFYEHLGFKVIRRSPLDGMGNPYPLLHMRLHPDR